MKSKMFKRATSILLVMIMLFLVGTINVSAKDSYTLLAREMLSQMDNSELYLEVYDLIDEAVKDFETELILDDDIYITPDELRMVFDAVYSDRPEYYWHRNSYSIGTDMYNPERALAIYLFYYIDEETSANIAEDFFEETDIILSGITKYMSEYEIVKYLHDTLIDRITFVSGAQHAHTTYGGLVTNEAVCEGYARAFQYLLNRLDMNCLFVTGSVDGGDHAWNLVEIDEKWYMIDLTWDDASVEDWESIPFETTSTARILRTYCNTTFDMMEEDHTLVPSSVARKAYYAYMPSCVYTDANYFYVNSLYVDASNPSVEGVAYALSHPADDSVRLYINGDCDAFFDWFSKNMADIYLAADIPFDVVCSPVFLSYKEVAMYMKSGKGTYTLHGTITTHGYTSVPTTISLFAEGEEDVPLYSKSFTGISASYAVYDLEPGIYTLRVAKDDNTTRDYAVTITSSDVTQNVVTKKLADINCDDHIDNKDVVYVMQYLLEMRDIDAGYDLTVADVNNDGSVDNKDAVFLSRVLVGKEILAAR